MKNIRTTKDWMLAATWDLMGYKVEKIAGPDGMPNWATDSSAELNRLMKDIDDGKIDINIRALRAACRRVKSLRISEIE